MEPGLIKKIGLFVGILAVVFVGFYLFTRDGDNSGAVLSEETAVTEGLGRELLGKLAQLQSIKLDDKFFTEKAYLSLTDYTIKIEDQPIGRQNPFFSVSASAVPTTTSSTVKLPVIDGTKMPAKAGGL